MKYLSIVLILLLINIFSQSLYSDSKNNPRSLGMNLAGIADWSTEYPFIDFVKSSRKWISQKKNAQWGKGGELELNSEGWIKFLKEEQFSDLIFVSYFIASKFSAGLSGSNNPKNMKLMESWMKSKDGGMGKIYEEHINSWYKSGGGLFMHFSDIGISSKYGSWGALESLNQKDSSKWKALRKFTTKK